MKTVELEFPYIASITDTGRLFITSRRSKDLPPATLVSLGTESAQKLLDLLQGIEGKKKDDCVCDAYHFENFGCSCGADNP